MMTDFLKEVGTTEVARDTVEYCENTVEKQVVMKCDSSFGFLSVFLYFLFTVNLSSVFKT